MKTIFRLSMVMAMAVLFIWGGVAVARDLALEPTSFEYLWAMETGALPAQSVPAKELAEVVKVLEVGTFEYNVAMETGNLPGTCGDMPCAEKEYTIVEYGGIPFRDVLDIGN
ncbi:MAG: hypothetical protein WC899_12395 [bacterium]|jgi:hypothetical protein